MTDEQGKVQSWFPIRRRQLSKCGEGTQEACAPVSWVSHTKKTGAFPKAQSLLPWCSSRKSKMRRDIRARILFLCWYASLFQCRKNRIGQLCNPEKAVSCFLSLFEESLIVAFKQCVNRQHLEEESTSLVYNTNSNFPEWYICKINILLLLLLIITAITKRKACSF